MYVALGNVCIYVCVCVCVCVCVLCGMQFLALAHQLNQVMQEYHDLEELRRGHSKNVVKRIMQGGKCMLHIYSKI